MTVPTNESALWASDGEFKMSSERPRELAWIATGGQTGVVGPESCEVIAQKVNDNTVRIMPGGFVAQATPDRIGSGYTTAPWQSYMRALYAQVNVPITATDSSGGRSDFVGIEIVDPVYEGTADTVDWETHEFWRPRVIENVSSDGVMVDGFKDMVRPFIPLARVDVPASTATISGDMITDLRYLAVERQKNDSITQRPPGSVSISEGDSQNLGVLTSVTVPTWATHVTIDGEINGARLSGSGTAQGNARVVVRHRSETNGETLPITWRSEAIRERFDMPVAGRVAIPKGDRGYPLEMWFRVLHNSGDATVDISEYIAAMRVRLTFEELPGSA